MTALLALLLALQLVADVHDGDTLRLQDGRRIRLWGIDAPELKQAYGTQARDFLAARVQGRTVRLVSHGEDRYGRQLAVVWVGGRDANASMLEAGLAWWYRKYTPEAKDYAALEARARAQRRGLWGAQFVAPWDWRHR